MMETTVPFDTSSPAVQNYISLIRLQVLTPLSLLVNIATIVICAAVISPSLDEVSHLFPTSISPKPWMIAMYGIAIWVGQIGYCMMLVMVRKPETKETLIHGSGQWLVWTNWVIAGWAVAFVMQGFLVATVLLGIALLLLLFSNVALLAIYPPSSHRPLDTGLIHAPLRLYLILPLMLLFPQALFIALGHSWSPGTPQHYASHQWEGFGVVLGTNLLGLLIVIFRRDVVWCVGATWLCAATFTQRPKPFPVYITALVFALLHPLALVASYLFLRLRGHENAAGPEGRSPKRGPIALPQDEEGGAVAVTPAHRSAQQPGAEDAREVDAEAIWG